MLPAEGAPLVFATQLAHDLKLHIETRGGPIDLPVRADPAQGGLVLAEPAPTLPESELTGVLRGKWGFDDWEGPRYQLIARAAGQVGAGGQATSRHWWWAAWTCCTLAGRARSAWTGWSR